MTSNRNPIVDIIRGFAMLLVVLGHTMSGTVSEYSDSLLFQVIWTLQMPLFIIISATILLNSIGMEWLYNALEQYTYITVRSIAFKLIAVIAMFLLVHSQADYVIYGSISIFAASASNLLNFANARRYIGSTSSRR